MRIAVFGATGGTGRQIVSQALSAGYQVQALVRDPTRLMIKHPDLTIIQGDVLEITKVAETVEDTEAVICSLGNTANNPDMVVSRGTGHIIEAMKAKARPRRLITVTSLGVGDSRDQVPAIFKMLIKTVLRKPLRDKEVQEKIIRDSGLDWIIVRPGGLTDNPATGNYRFGVDPTIVAKQVSRADVAAFVLRQLTDDTFLHQTPAIT